MITVSLFLLHYFMAEKTWRWSTKAVKEETEEDEQA